MRKLLVALFLLVTTLSFAANPFIGVWSVNKVIYNKTTEGWDQVPADVIVQFNEDFTFSSWAPNNSSPKHEGRYIIFKNLLVYSYDAEEIVDPTSGIRFFQLMDDGTIVMKSIFFLTIGSTSNQILELLNANGIDNKMPWLFMQVWDIYDFATDSDTQVLKRIEVKDSI